MIGKTFEYNIYYPSGNTTALVFGEDALEHRQEINNSILSTNSTIEQVGFVYLEDSVYHLEMAGGEFCGNATRSAAYYFLNGKDGEIEIVVSGIDKSIIAGVKNGKSYSEIPFERDSFEQTTDIQKIQGISHIIVEVNYDLSEQEAKDRASKIIDNYVNSINDIPPALGVMFINKSDSPISMFPVVKVFSIDTLFYETACGSGTACVGLYLHNKYSESISKLAVKQPSGEIIYVNIDFNGSQAVIGFIEGIQTIVAKNVKVTI